jgi:hypothetical protein
LGKVKVGHRRAKKLGVRKNSRLSPIIEKSCLLLDANQSYASGEKEIELLMGIKVGHSRQWASKWVTAVNID